MVHLKTVKWQLTFVDFEVLRSDNFGHDYSMQTVPKVVHRIQVWNDFSV